MAAIIKQQILFITSFPGRECGIATYSRDLIENLVRQFGSGMDFKICALEEGETEREYCQEVWTTFDTTNFNAYHQLATKINNSPEINVVVIQHEFGLFGGKNGVWILDFLQHLSKPVVTTFHTVLPDPDPERKQLVKAIADNSRHLLVMTKSSADILKSVYNIEGEKITVIPHGTHMVPWKGKAEMKKKYNVQDRLVLSTFGLISRNKGIETALDAMVGIKEQFPNVLYLILGKTHPGVVKHEGESYREYLQAKVDDLNLNANVKFVNKYLELNELLEYLTLTDIYLFTSIDPYQAVSGTFSYALGSACPVISTPIPHAIEMISDANGIIVDFRDPAQLKDAAVRLLADPVLRENMGKNAFHYMHKTIWQNVVIPHARIFESCNDHKDLEPLLFCLPEISLNHIRYLTTTAGIIQFSKICEPDIESGYTLDDNARALIAVSMLYAQQQDDAVLPLINTYLSFIEYCQQKNGSFLNYVDKHLQFTDANYAENLEDANGRAMWALGKFLSYHEIMPEDLLIRANKCIRKSLENVWQFQSPRAMAFAIKGLYFLSGYYENEKLRNAELLERLAEGLLSRYYDSCDEKWHWFEEYCTYANSSLPEAMLYAYKLTQEEKYLHAAVTSFDFLLSHLFTGDKIKVVSNRGWLKKGEQTQVYGEQPIDVSCTLQTLDVFYEALGNVKYKSKMENTFSWFLGNNHLQQIMYNPVMGGCYDGLEKDYVNLNMGAESTICYLIARLIMEKNAVNNQTAKNTNTVVRNVETQAYKLIIKHRKAELENSVLTLEMQPV